MLGLSTALALSAQAIAHEKDSENVEFYRVGDFGDVDANQDGKISKSEYLAYDKDSKRYDQEWREDHWDEMMEKFDGNDDNQLEAQEIEDYANARVAEVMDKLEGLHGNWVGEFDFDFDDEEFADRLEERLEGTHERMAEALERLHESEEGLSKWVFEFDRLPEMHEFAFTGPHRFMFQGRDDVVLEKMDADDDGKVSEEEFLKSRQEMFEKLDENNDGVLDEDEMKDFSWMGNYAFTWHDSEEDEE